MALQHPEVDPEMVDKIVYKLKSQGIFDQFRKDCLADVDSRPAYQNLRDKVNGAVASFLSTQPWTDDLNKNQVRETLRQYIQKENFLEVGVNKIVEQVVNPRIFNVLMPKVEDIVYEVMGVEKPTNDDRGHNRLRFLLSQIPAPPKKPPSPTPLPTDLEPISPVSLNNENPLDTSSIQIENDETTTITENKEVTLLEPSDSQLSGISDLSSHGSGTVKLDISESAHLTVAEASRGAGTPPLRGMEERSQQGGGDCPGELGFDNFSNLREKLMKADPLNRNAEGCGNYNLDNESGKGILAGEEKSSIASIAEMKTDLKSDLDDFGKEGKSSDGRGKSIDKSDESNLEKETKSSVGEIKTDLKSDSVGLEKEGKSSDGRVKSIDKNDETDFGKDSKSSDGKVKSIVKNEDTDFGKDSKSSDGKMKLIVKSDESDLERESSVSIDRVEVKMELCEDGSSEERRLAEFSAGGKDNRGEVISPKQEAKNSFNPFSEDSASCASLNQKTENANDLSRNSLTMDFDTSTKMSASDDKVDDSNARSNSMNDSLKENSELSSQSVKNDSIGLKTDFSAEKFDMSSRDSLKSGEDKKSERKSSSGHSRSHHSSKSCDSKYRSSRDKKSDGKEKRSSDKSRERDSKRKDSESKQKESEKDSRSKERHRSDSRHKSDKKTSDEKSDKRGSRESSRHESSKKDDRGRHSDRGKSRKSEDRKREEKSVKSSSKESDKERESRKRKREKCNDEAKRKESRRSKDRDDGGGGGSAKGDDKRKTSSKVATSAEGFKIDTKMESTGNSETQSDIDLILERINSSIQECEGKEEIDEEPAQVKKKPKIANNLSEVKRIMEERKSYGNRNLGLDSKLNRSENDNTVGEMSSQKDDETQSKKKTESSDSHEEITESKMSLADSKENEESNNSVEKESQENDLKDQIESGNTGEVSKSVSEDSEEKENVESLTLSDSIDSQGSIALVGDSSSGIEDFNGFTDTDIEAISVSLSKLNGYILDNYRLPSMASLRSDSTRKKDKNENSLETGKPYLRCPKSCNMSLRGGDATDTNDNIKSVGGFEGERSAAARVDKRGGNALKDKMENLVKSGSEIETKLKDGHSSNLPAENIQCNPDDAPKEMLTEEILDSLMKENICKMEGYCDSDSDGNNSDEKKQKNALSPQKRCPSDDKNKSGRSIQRLNQTQRYDSSELYKPRPLFSSTSRRNRLANSDVCGKRGGATSGGEYTDSKKPR